MNSHNTKPVFTFHKTPLLTDAVRLETKPVARAPAEIAQLSIADEAEFGCDPYNSTGQHVILQAKFRADD
jgi:hypothetical protein